MISGLCEYVKLLPNMAKRHFADVFELRVLSWEIILDYADELKIQSQIPYQGKSRGRRYYGNRGGHLMAEVKCYTSLKMEGGATTKECKGYSFGSWKRRGNGSFLQSGKDVLGVLAP